MLQSTEKIMRPLRYAVLYQGLPVWQLSLGMGAWNQIVSRKELWVTFTQASFFSKPSFSGGGVELKEREAYKRKGLISNHVPDIGYISKSEWTF